MNNQRRNVLRLTSVIALMASTGLITSAQAAEWNKAAFDEVLKAIGGAKPETSADIIMRAPDIAENGAVVPVGVETKLKATQIAILVEKNPSNLAAQFILPEGAEAFVTTRVKMGQSSNVHALVKADGKWYIATKEIKVTLGGCGG